jgi:hypothetical protein
MNFCIVVRLQKCVMKGEIFGASVTASYTRQCNPVINNLANRRTTRIWSLFR